MKQRLKTSTVVTAVSLQGRWVKLLQARMSGERQGELLSMKAHQAKDLTDESAAEVLKELRAALPETAQTVVGLVPKEEVLTRYLLLPSTDPKELEAMAYYQLEGMLPYPVTECVTSVKVLGPAGEATRVLVAAIPRLTVERLVRVCQANGLTPDQILVSSEAIGNWHRICQTEPGAPASGTWLAAEVSRSGIDLGVLSGGSLIYMRQVPHLTGGIEELTTHIQESLRAYSEEEVGPPVELVTLSGALQSLGPDLTERLKASVELPVRQVDPLERSPFQETLAVTAQEFAPEVSFSDLLGAVCAPRLLGLDLLPSEARMQQAKQALFVELKRTGILAAGIALVLMAWVGLRVGDTWWNLQSAQQELRLLTPQADSVRAMSASIQQMRALQLNYSFQMRLMSAATDGLLPGMTLQFLGLETNKALTLRGSAPDLDAVGNYAAALKAMPVWSAVTLRSAKVRELDGVPTVEFEMILKPKAPTHGT